MRFSESVLLCIHLIIIIIVQNLPRIQCLRCNEILEMPEDYTLSLEELQTIPSKDIVKCLAHLSRKFLAPNETDFIWQSIITQYDGIQNIPVKVLQVLRYVTVAVKPDDYANLTLGTIEVVENFGQDYNLDPAQLSAIADRVRTDFSEKGPEEYTCYDLIALNQILCNFNRSEIERIHPSAYKEAALELGKLINCDPEVMLGFATLATRPTAFGPPNDWTLSDVITLGKVAHFLPIQIIQRIKRKLQEENTYQIYKYILKSNSQD